MEGVGFVFLLLAFVVYFAPAIVAESRGREGAFVIGLLNLLLGWTVLAWVVLLIIAFTGESKHTRKRRDEELALLRQIAAKSADSRPG